MSCRHGPHQGAQKSTSTGTWAEASTTSVMKLPAVTVRVVASWLKVDLDKDNRIYSVENTTVPAALLDRVEQSQTKAKIDAKTAIDGFLSTMVDHYELIDKGYQVAVRKVQFSPIVGPPPTKWFTWRQKKDPR